MEVTYIVSYRMLRVHMACAKDVLKNVCCPIAKSRKALDNIDLNLVSHRYVSGVLKDDHFVSARSLARSLLASDPSPRGLFQP